MRAVAVTSSLILGLFKFQQHSALLASLPGHIREIFNEEAGATAAELCTHCV